MRLELEGYEGRKNHVVLAGGGDGNVVVYFGGDIQDFRENMETHRDNKNYLKWSLDNTAKLLETAFSDSLIIVVKPSKMEYKTFSCFENFVPCGNCGVPHHVPMHHSLQHLELLLKKISSERKHAFTAVTLIGFSKGCVVLNQFLHEFYATEEKSTFLALIKRMIWLDGGHSGGKNTWVTDKKILENFTRFDIQVFVHVSPYQIADDRRPWIKKEERIFYNTLLNLKASIRRWVHFEDQPASISNHFSILDEFYKKYS